MYQIHDRDAAALFHGKKNINLKATSTQTLFPEGAEKKSLDYVKVLEKAGIEVEMPAPKVKRVKR